ncbi:Uncharacterized protein GBIM_06084 [Gryllus bimaculatus]|nr:Uncharacterized protein GBIM_06084 [Gryllus bimaculatus]
MAVAKEEREVTKRSERKGSSAMAGGRSGRSGAASCGASPAHSAAPASASADAHPAPHSGGDFLATASSALRRLHFSRAGKANRQQQPPVPKVVIMGSSTASTSSNTTINTSTDSANTVATLVTVTDGDYDLDHCSSYLDDALAEAPLSSGAPFCPSAPAPSPAPSPHPGPPPPTPLLGAERRQQQREDHMRQLLDVCHTLTQQELHDFEMK